MAAFQKAALTSARLEECLMRISPSHAAALKKEKKIAGPRPTNQAVSAMGSM